MYIQSSVNPWVISIQHLGLGQTKQKLKNIFLSFMFGVVIIHKVIPVTPELTTDPNNRRSFCMFISQFLLWSFSLQSFINNVETWGSFESVTEIYFIFMMLNYCTWNKVPSAGSKGHIESTWPVSQIKATWKRLQVTWSLYQGNIWWKHSTYPLILQYCALLWTVICFFEAKSCSECTVCVTSRRLHRHADIQQPGESQTTASARLTI